MKKWLIENRKIIFIGSLSILVVVPFMIYLLSAIPIFPSGGNDWAGFWGGYAGAIIGGIITLFVLFKTLDDNKKLQERDERIYFLDNLGDLVADYITSLQDFNKKLTDYIDCNASNDNERKEKLTSAEISYIKAKSLGRRIFTKLRTHAKKELKDENEYIESLKKINTICFEANEVFNNKPTGSYESLFTEDNKVASNERIEVTKSKLKELSDSMHKFEDDIIRFISQNVR